MNKKQILSFFLSLSLVLTVVVVPTAAAFSDIPSSAWYAQDVAAVQKYGILDGTGNGKFSPDGNLTLAQAITMAARTYAYSNHETIPQTGGSAWYSDYIQYAAEKGICAAGEFGTAYNNYCNRLTMAKLFARVIPAGTDQAINDVTSLPDVQSVPENQAVFDLYQLGILTGSDKYGTFHPYQYIKRSETAAILNRVLNMENRKSFVLEAPPSLEEIYSDALMDAWNYFNDEFGYEFFYNAKEFLGMGDFGYTLYDIDGNGVDELLLGFTNAPESVYAVYAIDGIHHKRLITGDIYSVCCSPCYVYKNGVVSYHWLVDDGFGEEGEIYYNFSDGKSLSFIEHWQISGDEDGGIHYRYDNTSPDWFDLSNAPEVSESFVQNVRDKYGNPLEFQYTPVF